MIPENLEALFGERVRWMEVHNYSQTTIAADRQALTKFQRWCAEREVVQLGEVTPEILEAYQRWLHHQKSVKGKNLSPRTQHLFLGVVQRCFDWAHQQGYYLADPSSTVTLPRLPSRILPQVLSVDEIEAVLQLPDLNDPLGIRDRAILEVLYACAIRRSELQHLKPGEIDRTREVLWVRQGKGKKDRIVPISRRAIDWVERYENEVREKWLQKNPQSEELFLSRKGNGISDSILNDRIGQYLKKAVPNKGGNCHTMRHSVATILLENGCGIRYIQELLGHTSLTTTQIYTRVVASNLKEVYQRFHPSAQKG